MKRILLKSLFLISFLGSLLACKSNNKGESTTIDTPEPAFKKEGTLLFLTPEKDTLKVLEIEIAESSYEQQTGLMYRKSMNENRGMLFTYPDERPHPYFYMKNTYIPLDLIYIDASNKIVDFNENARPMSEETLPSDVPAKYVLEINGGKVKEWNLTLGDSVIIKPL